MDAAGRTLSPAVLKALTYWPGIVHAERPAPVDLAVLQPFFNELLGELPWWNNAWRVTRVEPAYPCEIASDHDNRISVVAITTSDTARRSQLKAGRRTNGVSPRP